MGTNTTVKNILILRDKKRLLQQDLAEVLNISISSYSKIELGKRELKVSELSIIANKLEVREIDLLTYPDVYEKKEVKYSLLSEPVESYDKKQIPIEEKNHILNFKKEVMDLNERIKELKDALSTKDELIELLRLKVPKEGALAVGNARVS